MADQSGDAATEHHSGERPIAERTIPKPPVDELELAQLGELAASEDETMVEARRHAGPDLHLPSAPTNALLTWLAATLGAKNVVELGSAAGLSGLALLRGIGGKGALTSVEPNGAYADLAQRAFSEVRQGRVRSIPGAPSEVLPRLSDGSYDLVLVQHAGVDPEGTLAHARRLLRPGGVLVARDVALDEQTDSAKRSHRELVQRLLDEDDVTVVVLPFDTGVALATFAASED